MNIFKNKNFDAAVFFTACFFMLFNGRLSTVWSATAPGTVISNVAQIKYTAGTGGTFSVDSNKHDIIVRSPSTIEFMQYAPHSFEKSEQVNVKSTEYKDATGAFVFASLPKPYGASATLDLSNTVPLLKANQFYVGDTLFIRLTDLDQNMLHDTVERVVVTLSIPDTNETETLRLYESGSNTGAFVGYVKTDSSLAQGNNGMLNYPVEAGPKINASYTDEFDGADTSTDLALLVDPFGVIFDSFTGAPLSGIEISLYNAATGQLANVFGEDGVSAYPNKVISGTNATDASGKVYTFSPGHYWFPLVAPGQYFLTFTAPAGYAFPSQAVFADLQALPGAPYVLDESGSRGKEFTVNFGPALRIDIPVDPFTKPVFLTKSASKSVVSAGDFLQYKITAQNTTALAKTNVVITDTLPRGFRYKNNSLKVDGASAADPTVSGDGRTLTIALGTITANNKRELSYVLEVSSGVNRGKAANTAVASDASGLLSNTASATVEVKDVFALDKAYIAGTVFVNACGNGSENKNAEGLEGVRLVLEDGTVVLTDKNGMYHFQGVKPGVHVVQLDKETLPENYEAVLCEENSRTAKTPFSQFVDVQGGTLWRVDFYVAPKEGHEEAINNKETESTNTESEVNETKTAPSVKSTPHFDEAWLDAAQPGLAWVYPTEGFNPPFPSLNIAVKHDPEAKLKVFLNGEEIDPLYFEVSFIRKDEAVAVNVWRAVPLKEGDNVLEAAQFNGDGTEAARISQTIHYAGMAVNVEVVAEKSVLIADGKTPPVIALRLTDKDGRPIREGVSGEYSVNPPYAPLENVDALQKNPLLAPGETARSNYFVGEDGMAFITLQPATKTGEVLVKTYLVNAEKETRVWLSPEQRDWILVGIANGTFGYGVVSENMQNLGNISPDDEKLYEDGRLALYAKGTVKGKWLLTLAYDTDKKWKKDVNSLHQIIDPDSDYILYGDATQQQYDAASALPLYLKIEREKFYALFGDFETGLTVTELSRYSRNFTGFKSEMKGDNFGFNAFVSDTNQKFVKDEIRGDGTSGLYALSQKNIVMNSETITIETRDRFHSETVLSSRTLSRHVDYNIDYDAGTIYFKTPVFSKDEKFNPIYIVVDYETYDLSDVNYGGRGALTLLENKLEAGVTLIHEGKVAGSGNLTGVDTTLKINDTTTLKAEAASTNTDFTDGSAYLAEISHADDKLSGKVYFRKQETGFGLGQQKGSESGTQKVGMDFVYRISDVMSVSADIYKNHNLNTDAVRNAGEAEVNYAKQNYTLLGGFRFAEDKFANGTTNVSQQIFGGGTFSLLKNRLSLRIRHDQSVGDNDNIDFPTRTTLGADFRLSKSAMLFVEQEITNGEQKNTEATRAGLKAAPWSGGEISTTVQNQVNENGTRLTSSLGLKQTWKVNEQWTVDAGLDRSFTLKDTGNNTQPLYLNVPVPETSGSADFTAVSLGALYKKDKWSWTGRLELRDSKTEDKFGVISGIYGEVKDGTEMSFGAQVFNSRNISGAKKTDGKLSLGIAYRPKLSKWIVLDRLEYIFEEQKNSAFNFDNWRLVNNLNANYKAGRKWQLATRYGAKYVGETIDGLEYHGYTDIIGLEARYDVTKKFDLGARGSVLHSWNAGQYKYGSDVSVGYNVARNMWFSVGYVLAGFKDKDFSNGSFTNNGPYVTFRLKFDHDSVRDLAQRNAK